MTAEKTRRESAAILPPADASVNRKPAAAVDERERVLTLMIEQAPLGIAMFDRDMRYLAASPSWITDHGLPAAYAGRSHYELFPGIPEASRTVHRRCLAGESLSKQDDLFVGPKGARQWVDWRCVPWQTEAGAVGGVVIMAENVTARKLATDQLRQSQADLAESQRVARIGCWTYEIATNAVRWSDELFRIFDVEPGEFGANFDAFMERVNVPDRERVRQANAAARQGKSPFDLEYQITTRTGEIRTIRELGYARKDAAGQVVELFGTAQDITARKQIEDKLARLNDELDRSLAERTAALHETDERLRLAVHAAEVGFWDWNLQTNEIYFTPEYKAQLGYSDAELPNDFQEWERRVHPDDLRPAMERTARTLAGQDLPHEVEFRMRHRDGSWRWILGRGEVHRDAAGQPVRMLGCHLDITRRKQAEEAVQIRKAQLRAILDTAPDAIVTIDHQGLIQTCNPATERMFGYNQGELIGRNVRQLMAEPFRQEHDGYLAWYLAIREPRVIGRIREGRARRQDGTEFPVELAVSEIPALRQFTGIIRDISRRKELEQQVVEIATLEQQRIGQDLHDELGQQLSALGLLASSVSEVLRQTSPDHAKLAERMESVACSALRSVRTIATGLVTGEIDRQGLPQALAELCHRLDETSATRFEFHGSPAVALPDGQQATHLYHIAQEACTNIMKHAAARHAQIDLELSAAEVLLRIADDGQGLPASVGKKGLGLRIMQNRARLIGATVEVNSPPTGGTVVTCRLPREDVRGS